MELRNNGTTELWNYGITVLRNYGNTNCKTIKTRNYGIQEDLSEERITEVRNHGMTDVFENKMGPIQYDFN